ncbi:major facilitator superfamily domain-containing protein [Aspergillus similis]
MREAIGMPQSVKSAVLKLPIWTATFDYGSFPVVYESGLNQVPVFDAHIEVYGTDKIVRVNYDTPLLPHNGLPWYRKHHLLRLNYSLLCLFLLYASDGYDGTLMSGLQALPRWQAFMKNPTGAWLGFVNAVQTLSAFVLYPIVAWCSDRYGRKTTLCINFLWLALAVGLQTAAINPTMFVFVRLFIGASASFTSGSAPILMAETAYPTHRGITTAIFMCGWHVGLFLAAWVTFGTRNAPDNWSWRIPSLLQCAIPVLALPSFLMAPETPRWLVSQERVEEAHAFLIKYHAGGDENSPLANFELQKIINSLALEARYRKSSSWLDLLRGCGNRHRTFISVTLGLWNLVLSIGAAFNVDRFGRRPLFLVSSVGMLCPYIVISGLSGSRHSFLYIYYGFYDIAFTPLLVSYTCEIWPYDLRAKGLALGMNSTRVALFFNTFVNPIILDDIAWKYYIVYCVILVVISVTIWLWYPDTKGYTLEEASALFDRDPEPPQAH